MNDFLMGMIIGVFMILTSFVGCSIALKLIEL